MELVSSKSFKDEKLANNEFVVLYIFAEWCGACKNFTPMMENEIVPEIEKKDNDIKFFKMSATDQSNQEFLKEIAFESLPYMAVYHQGNFIGGDSMASREAMDQFVQMVQVFKQRQAQQVLDNPEYEEVE